MMQQLQRIRNKLTVLQSEGWEQYQEIGFGVKSHRFKLDPPLSEHLIHQFETRYRVTLPNDYRNFLLHMGNGGAGPYYGILPLEEWDDIFYFENPVLRDQVLAAPCLLTPALERETHWCEQLAGTDWEHRYYETEAWHPYQGTLPICSQGCTYYSVLILNGPERNRVCNIDQSLQPPQFSPHANFLDWYEDWLNQLLQRNKLWWFGYPDR
jgi:hypothetical protein